MRVVVTGAAGQLGTDLCQVLEHDPRVLAWQGLTRAELDVTDAAQVRAVLRDQARPAKIQGGLVVINTAAWTDVDGAEQDEAGAYALNASAPGLLAASCAEVGATLIHISTDYVFPGDATRPYDVDDPTGPASAYGRTKLAGEQAVRMLLPDASYVVRTSWVYGASGGNFVKTMARLERERQTLTVVDDQRGCPTWSADLARGLVDLAASTAAPGIYHLAGGEETTWCGLARAVFEELGADPDRVQPTTSAEFVRPAPRPAYSVLSVRAWQAAGLTPLRDWREALTVAFREVGDALRGVPANS
jgi:dTDP-4-dehydrorhamnose reductase